MMSHREIKQINQSLGKSAPIGIFTGFQFAVVIPLFGLGFFLAFALGLNLAWSILIGCWLSATALALSGKKPHLFWSKIYPIVPVWSRGYTRYLTPQQKQKIGAKKIRSPWK